ncbi:MAG: protein kinase [Gammaproteobacteria bacterium RIFCSPHIGHO2_12_FULL_38_14]|nr:MAG: protein kinase [Gammaproteobacteria bacterium RIFCSPHIGHO2_12_FULL_38_14]
MNKRFRRITDSDVKSIIADLDRWAAGQLGSKLTWATLEERSGFSRQSLQAKAEIKAAYDYAKKSLAGGLVKSREQATQENEELLHEVQRLKLEVSEYKRREHLWRERWQRIAFHIRQKGMQIHEVDQLTEESKLTERETSNILRLFDKEIPSSGRI